MLKQTNFNILRLSLKLGIDWASIVFKRFKSNPSKRLSEKPTIIHQTEALSENIVQETNIQEVLKSVQKFAEKEPLYVDFDMEKAFRSAEPTSSSGISCHQFPRGHQIELSKYSRDDDKHVHDVSVGPDLEEITFPGSNMKGSTELNFLDPRKQDLIPVYKVLSRDGRILKGSEHPKIEKSKILDMYTKMVLLNIMDTALNNSDISLYITSYGEEATQIGSAAAVHPSDLIYGQYRETGVLMWRGFTLDDFMNQCFNNDRDPTKGRQMPIHYGSKELNFVSISSCLATQMPQAAGAAYAYKMSKRDNCVVCYFGEGTASEGDAHVAFNFASVLDCPVVFFCRNNGFAISTPVEEQYKGDGIASRGAGYGILSTRVDGNDVFAVYNAVKAAREICVRDTRPVLIEAMTYRVGDHSTLVDSENYRTKEEVDIWEMEYNPITRFRNYLRYIQIWTDDQEEEFRELALKQVSEALLAAQSRKYSSPAEMFMDVYDVMPKRLAKQQKELKDHLIKYRNEYPTEKHHFYH